MTNPTDQLLKERGAQHGNFEVHAAITQALKTVGHASPNWGKLSSAQKEALEMGWHKDGRILAGDPNLPDHWDDKAGYARLVSQTLTPMHDEKLSAKAMADKLRPRMPVANWPVAQTSASTQLENAVKEALDNA